MTLGSLFAAFWPRILGTWAMTLMEIALFALIPLLIGRAIDGLTGGDTAAFVQLAVALAVLILLGTLRRVFDTRAYGVMRVELGKDLARRSSDLPVSRLSARLGMGRELVDFLETELPEAMTALFRTFAAVVILFGFHPALAGTAAAAALVTLTIYGLAHGRFYRLNRALNEEAERQVQVLEGRSIPRLGGRICWRCVDAKSASRTPKAWSTG
ncbi:ABC transporter six-transmembrane domain-containing protein [Jhaorihella thermophila]